ncbi:MAG: hypothetical protein HYZ42_04675 [Bacteroidetes bacterium]|nr:hypothetical protein [Bacteroidota bacterium]
MKKLTLLLVLFSWFFADNTNAQQPKVYTEKFGQTFNLGIGIGGYSGYYRYVGNSLPVISANYEFDVAKNFTLAPFISYSSYTHAYYWGNKNYPYKYYNFRETVIPIGIKGTYYFDQLVNAGSKWDFYVAGSLGFAIVRTRWDSDYYGDRNYYQNASPLLLDLHIGTEYHFNKKIGAFLDLSTGVSTIGLAFH